MTPLGRNRPFAEGWYRPKADLLALKTYRKEWVLDAKLYTQSDINGLRMLDIEQYSDDSGGVCNLDVQSSPFQAQVKFFFDNPSLLEARYRIY